MSYELDCMLTIFFLNKISDIIINVEIVITKCEYSIEDWYCSKTACQTWNLHRSCWLIVSFNKSMVLFLMTHTVWVTRYDSSHFIILDFCSTRKKTKKELEKSLEEGEWEKRFRWNWPMLQPRMASYDFSPWLSLMSVLYGMLYYR